MTGEHKSLRNLIQDYRVSSVLNNDRKQYGKKYLFDGKDETCWNSDGGSPQWIELTFPEPKTITQLVIQFQGGFAAKVCSLNVLNDEGEIVSKTEFYPKDTNTGQTFTLTEPLLTSKKFKLLFLSSYDFYGRIIIYDFDIIGN